MTRRNRAPGHDHTDGISSLKLTAEERDILERAAKRRGMFASGLIRMVIRTLGETDGKSG